MISFLPWVCPFLGMRQQRGQAIVWAMPVPATMRKNKTTKKHQCVWDIVCFVCGGHFPINLKYFHLDIFLETWLFVSLDFGLVPPLLPGRGTEASCSTCGADRGAVEHDGWGLLHWGSYGGHHEVVQLGSGGVVRDQPGAQSPRVRGEDWPPCGGQTAGLPQGRCPRPGGRVVALSPTNAICLLETTGKP